MNSKRYRVLYTKSSQKKRKSYSDGTLHIHGKFGISTMTAALKGEDGVEVFKKSIPEWTVFELGSSPSLGPYELQIEEEIFENSIDSISEALLPSGGQKSESTSRIACLPFKTPRRLEVQTVRGAIPAVPTSQNGTSAEDAGYFHHSLCSQTMSTLEKINKPFSAPKQEPSHKPQRSYDGAVHSLTTFTTSTSTSTSTSSRSSTNPVNSIPAHVEDVDKALTRLMKPHQIEATDFILNCFRGVITDKNFVESMSSSGPSDIDERDVQDKDEDDDPWAVDMSSDDESFEKIRGGGGGAGGGGGGGGAGGFQSGPQEFTGAVLADEMGLGKTLSAIAVMWSLVKGRQRRGVVVCPSSLIDNWLREFTRWLSVKISPLSVRPGQDPAPVLTQFRNGVVTEKSSVLVISYEMFRKYEAQINSAPKLQVLVCDEGHRLKNSTGTKTIAALRDCPAKLRLVLTGTPLQNDLDELFAVISFAVPGFLGSLSEYKAFVSTPITRCRDGKRLGQDRDRLTEVVDGLRRRLSLVVLRRTQTDVLRGTLPPRTDITLFCSLSAQQRIQYDATVSVLARDLDLSVVKSSEGVWVSAGEGRDDEAEESRASLCGGAQVLPVLQRLRSICNRAGQIESEATEAEAQPEAAAVGGCVIKAKSVKSFQDLMNASIKLQVLDTLLTRLREYDVTSKVVVVSNFTSMLNDVAELASHREWRFLRLDGSVAMDKRQSLVDCFNRQSDNRFLFLLSSKAGGVGLNLIGGSRLVMMDCDWNPACDKQAMSRIWRQGQTRPVFIYRLVSHGCLEDAMLQRQTTKSELGTVLEVQRVGAASVLDENIETNVGDIGGSEGRSSDLGVSSHSIHLSKEDLRRLLAPHPTPTSQVDLITTLNADPLLDVLMGRRSGGETGLEGISGVKCYS